MRHLPRIITLSAVLALTGLSTAHAQGPGGQGPGGEGPGPGAWGSRRPPAEMQARRAEAQRQRAADLKTILRLRPDQEAALNAFIQSRQPLAPPAAPAQPPPVNQTTPERLDQMASRQAALTAPMQRRIQGLRTFYAALNPEQQQVFDALQRMRGGMGGPDGPGGRMMIMRHGGPGGPGEQGPRGPGGPPPR